ncbi:MAG TPA: GNAT family N-acetyltransferase, partial [Candidatus Baltobacteraceae bacterium]|nr:GNAT family N-acetyltransferase [Candidatus Baltobacteraceae bacterium]
FEQPPDEVCLGVRKTVGTNYEKTMKEHAPPRSLVRRANRGDADAIARVHMRAWHESYRGLVPDQAIDRQTIDIRRREWARDLTRDNWFTHVAQIGEEIVGFVCGFPDASEPGYDSYLNTLYVLQSAQRRGIARALLEAVVADLVRCGCTSMWWLTLKENPACAFYERIGAKILRDQAAPAILGAGVADRVFGLAEFSDLR